MTAMAHSEKEHFEKLLALIETEQDAKYRRKYTTVWRKTSDR